MHAYTLSDFKKISLQRKIILKLENEINDLNNTLDSLKEEHTYLVSEQFNVFDALAEKVVKIDCDTCSILKHENEKLKGQLAQAISLSTTLSTSSSERGIGFEKNHRFARRNRKRISSRETCHYYGDKGHIRPLCHIRNVKVRNGTIT